ncbi:hypothetical protein [Parasphingorhabdus pacifica]
MQSPTRISADAPHLPEVLAEYGRLAAQLPDATPDQVERLHRRLAELDVVIDTEVAAAEVREE